MRSRARKSFVFFFGVALLAALPLTAEEFHLKDGTKIVGKIVGYEKDAFRVETSFGIAIIFKDRIVRIEFPEGSAREEPGKVAAREAESPPPSKAAASASRTSARSSAPPPPEKIIEHVTSTEYVNETYHFRLFKPPTWRSYPQFVKPQGPVVTALGTPDETTLLLIGRESYNGNLGDYARQAERSLKQLYEDYRREEDTTVELAGLPAIERHFTGGAEGRFWTGVAIYFARGQQHYTVLALTSVTENTGLQQAVLRRVLNTLEFLPE